MVEYETTEKAILSLHNNGKVQYWILETKEGLQIQPSGEQIKNNVYRPEHHPKSNWPAKTKEKHKGVFEFGCFCVLEGQILIIRNPFCFVDHYTIHSYSKPKEVNYQLFLLVSFTENTIVFRAADFNRVKFPNQFKLMNHQVEIAALKPDVKNWTTVHDTLKYVKITWPKDVNTIEE